MKLLFWLVVFINLLAAGYGFLYFYGDQLAQAPLYLAIFIPDCPLYALLFVVAILLIETRERFDAFYFVVAIGLMKYGFWTVFVLSSFWSSYAGSNGAVLTAMLIITHVGLFAEAVAILGRINLKKEHVAIALAWFALNDFSDYFLGTRPPIPEEHVTLIAVVAVSSTLVFTSIAAYAMQRYKKPIVHIFSW
ncbi:MAG: DUF1405 domain-containing protein [Candidatus Micrarchaeota archaeon]